MEWNGLDCARHRAKESIAQTRRGHTVRKRLAIPRLEDLAVLEVDDADVGWVGQARVDAAELDAEGGDVNFCS